MTYIGQVNARKGHEAQEELKLLVYVFTFLSAGLDRSGWLTPHPGRFFPKKVSRYSLYKKLGMSQGRFGAKINPPPVLDTRIA
jgi:hypothetical protein